MASSLLHTQTTLAAVSFLPIAPPSFLSPHCTTIALSLPFNHSHRLHTAISKPKYLTDTVLPGVSSKSRMSFSISPAIQNPVIESPNTPNPFEDWLSGSTQTIATLVAIALMALKFVAYRILSLTVQLKEPVC